jgi:membrane protein required for colicin V production
MTLVDYIILLVLVVSAGVGVWRGFVKEALSLLTLLVAIWLAWRFATLVAPKLSNWAADQDVRIWIARGIIFALALIVGALVSWLARQLIRHTGLSGVDRMLGAAFGFARGVLIVGLLVLALDFLDLDQDGWWQSARFRPYAEQVAAAVKKYAELGTRYVQGGVAV